MRKIDLIKAIRTFLIVVEEQSFTGASAKLSLVVSAVSRQVSDLEEYFDCQLLYRTTRSMHLTAEGMYFLEQFKEIVYRFDSLENRSAESQNKIAGHLRVTAPPGIGQLGVSNLISQFIKQYPEVELTCLLVNRHVNLVEEGIDLAIRFGELPDSSLVARLFAQQNVLFVASPAYLSKYGTPKHPKELSKHACVIDNSIRQSGRWRYRDDNREQHVNVSGSININQGDMVAEFSAADHGVAYLPDFLVQPYLDSGELLSILRPYQFPPVPISLVYPANRMKSPALNALVTWLLNNKP